MPLLDAYGNPLPASGQSRMPRAAAFAGGFNFPYEAGKPQTVEMGDWLPTLRSPDSEINQHRDRIVARSRDMVRNDCWTSGVTSRILDSTIGAHYRVLAKPDYHSLAFHDKAFDEVWAGEYAQAAEAIWRNYADDLGHYNDVTRKSTISQQFRLGMGHKLVDGEALTLGYWLPERVGYGAARYATSFLVLDPDRLSNPYQMPDDRYMRGGIELDDLGVPVAYHIRKAEPNDWYNALESMQWDRVLREDPEDGWQRVFHDFDGSRAGQNRGVSAFAPVLSRMKMLSQYYGIELQAATIAATFGMFVTSPYDPAIVEEAVTGNTETELKGYQALRADWATERPAMINGVKVPTLAPGEGINAVSSSHPHNGFSPFANEMLRGLASVLGTSAEQVTQDYSKASWSSARAGIVEAEKMYRRRVIDFNFNTANPQYAAVLGEAHERGELPLPMRAPAFVEARTAYARCRWLGAQRGWVDPVAERQGAVLGMDAGFGTLEDECARQGTDWRDNIAQRKREHAAFKEAGLPTPLWFGDPALQTPAQQTIVPPEAQ